MKARTVLSASKKNRSSETPTNAENPRTEILRYLGRDGTEQCLMVKSVRQIGRGTFGIVSEIIDVENRRFCVKSVWQNPECKNRELKILKMLDHPNCIHLYGYYEKRHEGNIFLYLITDCVPQDLAHYVKSQGVPPPSVIQVFAYQMFKCLKYLHSMNICHRDMKPQNVLVDDETFLLKICDFGTAKMITSGDISVSYMATRNYRAPELILGCEQYGPAIDIWATGCVIAEMMRGGVPLFNGTSGPDMLLNIAQAIGSPTDADVMEMDAKCAYNGPVVPHKPISSILPEGTSADLADLLSLIFVYSPVDRATADDLLAHQYFDDIRDGKVILPNGQRFVDL